MLRYLAMRYGLFIFIFAILGIGEYAFVEFYPLSPYQRVYKFQELPIVKQIVIRQEANFVKRAIAETEDGCINVNYRNEGKCWSSVEDWREDRSSGHRGARWLAQRLKDQEKAKEMLPELIARAEQGDPSAAFQLHMSARYTGQTLLVEKALDILKDSPTEVGKYYHYRATTPSDSSQNGRESAFRMMKVIIENWRNPHFTDKQFEAQTTQNNSSIALLLENATQGSEDAIWIVDRLKAEGYLR